MLIVSAAFSSASLASPFATTTHTVTHTVTKTVARTTVTRTATTVSTSIICCQTLTTTFSTTRTISTTVTSASTSVSTCAEEPNSNFSIYGIMNETSVENCELGQLVLLSITNSNRTGPLFVGGYFSNATDGGAWYGNINASALPFTGDYYNTEFCHDGWSGTCSFVVYFTPGSTFNLAMSAEGSDIGITLLTNTTAFCFSWPPSQGLPVVRSVLPLVLLDKSSTSLCFRYFSVLDGAQRIPVYRIVPFAQKPKYGISCCAIRKSTSSEC